MWETASEGDNVRKWEKPTTIDSVAVSRGPDMSRLPDIIASIKNIPHEYREWYSEQEVEENWEPLVFADEFGIQWEDIYGKYAHTSAKEVIEKKKLNWVLQPSETNSVSNEVDVSELGYDEFINMEKQEDKEAVIREIAWDMGIEIVWEINNKLDDTREALVLIHNNSQLNKLGISQKIQMRKEVAEKLKIANRSLQWTWLSIGISNGLRSPEMQRTIKENHTLLKWEQEANKLFASEENSPHLSWWAVDVYIMKDGKKIDLKLWNNSPETKTPLYDKVTTPSEEEILKLRHTLLVTMRNAWFAINPTEYWHFCYGDRMWAYLHEKDTWNQTIAKYGRPEKAEDSLFENFLEIWEN